MKKEKRWIAMLFVAEVLGLTAYEKLGYPRFFYTDPDWKATAEVEDAQTTQWIIAENSCRLENEILKENRQVQEKREEAEQSDVSEKSNTSKDADHAEDKTDEVASQTETVGVDSAAILEDYFVIDPDTQINAEQLDAGELLGRDMRMEQNSEKPQILIYHTHSQEGFLDSVDGDPETTVVGVGNYLTELLQEQYGYQVLHVTSTFDLVEGELDRNQAYTNARPVIEAVLDANPGIEVVIDLHRDGVREDRHLVTEIDGKQTAQIMFFNGLSYTLEKGELTALPNPYIRDNLAFSLQLKQQAEQLYPGWQRCIYLKGYRYNLHFRPRCLLLEVGAQTNTLEEEKNAMVPFADILNRVLTLP